MGATTEMELHDAELEIAAFQKEVAELKKQIRDFNRQLSLLVEHHDFLMKNKGGVEPGDSEEDDKLCEEMGDLHLVLGKEQNEVFKKLSARLMQVRLSHYTDDELRKLLLKIRKRLGIPTFKKTQFDITTDIGRRAHDIQRATRRAGL